MSRLHLAFTKITAIVSLAAATAVGVNPANAGWQYTNWGMSYADVLAAAKYASGEGRLVRGAIDDRDCAYGQPYAQSPA